MGFYQPIPVDIAFLCLYYSEQKAIILHFVRGYECSFYAASCLFYPVWIFLVSLDGSR